MVFGEKDAPCNSLSFIVVVAKKVLREGVLKRERS